MSIETRGTIANFYPVSSNQTYSNTLLFKAYIVSIKGAKTPFKPLYPLYYNLNKYPR